MGAVAAASYRATVRPTDDIDYLVAWDESLVPDLVDAGFDVRVIEDEGEPQMIRARRSDGQVDIVVARTEYQHLALERAVDHVLTVEDVVIHKLIAWRPRDQDDVRSILSTGLALDDGYVAHWAGEWGVEDEGEPQVVIHKLIAWRPRDQDDVRSILSTGLALDDGYVAHWAGEWGVEDRWRQIRG